MKQLASSFFLRFCTFVYESLDCMRGRKSRFVIGGLLAMLAAALMLPTGSEAASKYKLLHFFHKFDGANPTAGLIFDATGNLFTTTALGGSGAGTVIKLAPNQDGSWTESVLYEFTGGKDGGNPYAGLIEDQAGNLYGTTVAGGILSGCNGNGCGVIFKLAPNQDGSWTESVLHSFTGGQDGAQPYAGLIFDGTGNLYGTTRGGQRQLYRRLRRGLQAGSETERKLDGEGAA